MVSLGPLVAAHGCTHRPQEAAPQPRLAAAFGTSGSQRPRQAPKRQLPDHPARPPGSLSVRPVPVPRGAGALARFPEPENGSRCRLLPLFLPAGESVSRTCSLNSNICESGWRPAASRRHPPHTHTPDCTACPSVPRRSPLQLHRGARPSVCPEGRSQPKDLTCFTRLFRSSPNPVWLRV